MNGIEQQTKKPYEKPACQQSKKPYEKPTTSVLGTIGKWLLILCTVIVLVVAAVFFFAYRAISNTGAEIAVDDRIDVTPTHVELMKQIGEWEFLSIADEELVDTMRPGFFSDDELIRIYYGTMRLGIDMSDANESWISHDNDTIEVTLPPIRLLDDRFIDEARTKSFFESGSWSDADREAMYQRARQRMMVRGLSKSNMESAEQNASRQFYQMMRSMGFEHVKVRFAQTPQERKKQ
jgi:hypothetical protein